jgi:hypothetical protein
MLRGRVCTLSRFTHIRSQGAGKSSWKDFWEFAIDEKKYRVEVEFKAFLAYEIILYLDGVKVSSSKPISNSLLKGNAFQDEKLTFKIDNHQCIFICKSSIGLEYDLFVDGVSVGNGEGITKKELEMDKIKTSLFFNGK